MLRVGSSIGRSLAMKETPLGAVEVFMAGQKKKLFATIAPRVQQ